MKPEKQQQSFSKVHTVHDAQMPHAELKKLGAEHKCAHRTAAGFCTRSNRACPAFLINNL